MKEIFTAFVSYNAKANAAVAKLIEPLDQATFCRDFGVFYRGIPGTLAHVMVSDARWLERFKAFRESASLTPSPAELKEAIDRDPDCVFDARASMLALRTRIDGEMISLVDAMPEGSLVEDIEIPFGKGRMKRPLWQFLLQWFNHHTHHRGHISAMLDIAGVEHDFSLMLDKIG